jgi:hypothetical protein
VRVQKAQHHVQLHRHIGCTKKQQKKKELRFSQTASFGGGGRTVRVEAIGKERLEERRHCFDRCAAMSLVEFERMNNRLLLALASRSPDHRVHFAPVVQQLLACNA